jgi:signal-transduction protein with cAMP-binding, CBS, and nucleotidyltransferase domain
LINVLDSFYNLKASELNIDALEDTVVLLINRDDMISIYKQAPKFDRIFRILVENSFIRLQHRLLQNISSTAEERYKLRPFPHSLRQDQIDIPPGICLG